MKNKAEHPITDMTAIVVPDSTSPLLTYGAEELNAHIALVTGTSLTVSAAMREAESTIVIATPDILPELSAMFAEDIAWLTDLGKEGTDERFGDDGFAIRQTGNTVYIFGATAKGALNGVYDFIEKNLGVIWVRGDESVGTVYQKKDSFTVTVTNYREKSPFALRGWHLCCGLNENDGITKMLSRNKMNVGVIPGFTAAENGWATSMGIEDIEIGHTAKWLIYISPLYDEAVSEFWNTTPEGEPGTIASSVQINFWSDLTADAVAASLTNFFDTYGKAGFFGIEDVPEVGSVPGKDTEPYEYAPGKFVSPEDPDYVTTVYWSFINKVARKVAKTHPDLMIPTFAYFYTEDPPRCELEDNVIVYFAPIWEEINKPIDYAGDSPAGKIYRRLEAWKEKTRRLVFYNYYGCFIASNYYERAIWHKMQGDLRYYASIGAMGLLPEGNALSDNWAMNGLTYWLYGKLCWNPHADVDGLIREFCDKCYGNASSEMQEYYRLIKAGWDEGSALLEKEVGQYLKWHTDPSYYYAHFLRIPVGETEDLIGAIRRVLDRAMEAADDTAKERIRHIRDSYAADDLFHP